MDRETYINELRDNLKKLPAGQKDDIIREISQHIADSVAAGKEESVILDRLGAPKILAKSLAGEYYINRNNIFKAIPFFISAGMSSFFMIFMFGGMVLLFGIGAVGSVVGGIMRTFGNTSVNLTMFNMEVPRALSIPAGLLTACFLATLAFLCCRVLKKHFIRVANNYKKQIHLQ